MSNIKKNIKKFKKLNLEEKFSIIAGVLTVVFFSVLAFSSIFLQKTLREETQEIRKDASVAVGTVFITTSDAAKKFTINQEDTISLLLHTQNTPVKAVQLDFEVVGKFDTPPTISINNQVSTTLQLAALETTETTDGYHVSALVVPINIPDPFSTSTDTPFLSIKLLPVEVGTVALKFDNSFSAVIRNHDDNDVLNIIPAMGFVVENEQSQINYCSTPTGVTISSLSCNDSQKLTAVMEWEPVAGAVDYEIQTGRTNNFQDGGSATAYKTTNTSTNFVNISDGSWFARVRVNHGDDCVQNDDGWQTIFFEEECQAEETCQYGMGEWGECKDGWQTRGYTVSPDTCAAPNPSTLTQACAIQCEYNYSDWSECTNGWQTREYTTQPQDCHWYETSSLEKLSQRCDETQQVSDLHLYNYESCWYGNSGGKTTSIYWNDAQFSNASWVDISPYADFREFANKNVETGTTQYYQYLLTNGQGFKWSTSGNPDFYFKPNTTYYVRLYNGTHSSVETYYMPVCSGVGGVSYKQCNESCTNNSECAPNLSCYQNQCRLVTNLESEICVLPPDAGLDRTCNEYCADNNECTSGFVCSWNRCRNPLNLDATDCRKPEVATNTTYKTLASLPQIKSNVSQYCNAYCNYNRDCGPNFRCYENQCRLATNPKSNICDPYDLPSSTEEKGADDGTKSNSETTTSTIQKEEPTIVSDRDLTTSVSVGDEDGPSKPLEEQTALDALLDYLNKKGYSLQVLGSIILGLILLSIMIAFIRNLLRKSNKPPKVGPANTITQREKIPTSANKNSSRIEIKEHPVNVKKPIEKKANPEIDKPLEINKELDLKQSDSTPPQVSQTPPISNKSSEPTSMMERLKEKGVKTPN